jgi:hypothetical protein
MQQNLSTWRDFQTRELQGWFRSMRGCNPTPRVFCLPRETCCRGSFAASKVKPVLEGSRRREGSTWRPVAEVVSRSAASRCPKPSPGRPCVLKATLCPRTPKHNTRRYEHPLAGGPSLSGRGYTGFDGGVNFAITEFYEVEFPLYAVLRSSSRQPCAGCPGVSPRRLPSSSARSRAASTWSLRRPLRRGGRP